MLEVEIDLILKGIKTILLGCPLRFARAWVEIDLILKGIKTPASTPIICFVVFHVEIDLIHKGIKTLLLSDKSNL